MSFEVELAAAISTLESHREGSALDNPDRVDEIARALTIVDQHPNTDAIPGLVNVIDDWDDMQLVESIQRRLAGFPKDDVVQALLEAVDRSGSAKRVWLADTVRYFPDPRFIPFLKTLLWHDDELSRLNAATALEEIEPDLVREIAAARLAVEEDEEVVEILEKIVNA